MPEKRGGPFHKPRTPASKTGPTCWRGGRPGSTSSLNSIRNAWSSSTRPVRQPRWHACAAGLSAASVAVRPCPTAMCGRPPRCKKNFRIGLSRSRLLPCVRPQMRREFAAGQYGSPRIRSTSLERARSATRGPGSSDPVSPTLRHTCPVPLLRRRQPRDRCRCYAATTGAR
jgi:hypothetical protein